MPDARHKYAGFRRVFTAPPFLALVRRELVRSLRKVRAFVFLTLFVMAAIFLLIINWPYSGMPLSNLLWPAQGIFTALIGALFVTAAILMPAYGATSIVVEREANTYDLLAMTLIRPSGILLGKLLNTIGILTLFFIAILPILATLFFLVGIDWTLFFGAVGIIYVTALWCAAVGILCSVRFRGMVTAVLISYTLVVLFMGIYLIPVWVGIAAFNLYQYEVPALTATAVLSPVGALAIGANGDMTPSTYAFMLVVQSSYALLALFLAWSLLRRSRETRSFTRAWFFVRRRVFGYGTSETSPSTPVRGPISDRWNPIFVKEVQCSPMRRRSNRLVVFCAVALLIGLLQAILWVFWEMTSPWTGRNFIAFRMLYGWAWIIMGTLLVVVPAVLANSLTKEYERRNIDGLRMTLLKSRQIIWGKACAGLVAVVPVYLSICATGLLSALMMGGEGWMWRFVVVALGSAGVCVCVSLTLSMFASLMTKRTPAGIVLSYLCSWTIMFGFCACAWWSSAQYFERDFALPYYRPIGFLSPMFAFFTNFQRDWIFVGPDIDWMTRRGGRDLVTPYWIANVIFHIMFCGFLLAVCTRAFRKSRMQDP